MNAIDFNFVVLSTATAIAVALPVVIQASILGKRIREVDLAIELVAEERLNMPGRGYMAGGDTPRAPNIPSFNYHLVDRCLRDPIKCQSAITFTPNEFLYWLPLFEAEGLLSGLKKGSKMNFREKLFVLLYFMKNNSNYTSLESTFNISKSCVEESIENCAEVLLRVLKNYFRALFPNRAERDLLKLFLPTRLRTLAVKPFFVVDSSKISNVDSISHGTRQLHYSTHKGFGPNMNVICDILGNPLDIMELQNGNEADIIMYRSTDWFHQLNGLNFDNDETGIGDSSYVGKVKCNGPAEFLQKYSAIEINAMNPQLALDAKAWNKTINTIRAPVEQVNGGLKSKSALQGDRTKGRCSIATHFTKIRLLNLLAQYIHIATLRMRNQLYSSNPAVHNHGDRGVDATDKVLNQKLYTERLLTSRPGYYFGGAMAGNGTDCFPVYANF